MKFLDSTITGFDLLRNNSSIWNNLTRFWKEMTFPILASVANTVLQTASKYTPPGRNHKLGFATIPDDMYYCQIINIAAAAKQKTRLRKVFNRVKKMKPVEADLLEPRFQGEYVKRRWIKGAGRGKANRGGKKGYWAYAVDEKKRQIKVDVDQEVKNINRGNDEIPLYKEDWAAIKQGHRYKIVSNKAGAPRKTLGYAKTMPEAKKMARILNRGLAKYSWGTLLKNFSEDQSTDRINIHTSVQQHATFLKLAAKSPNITKYVWGKMKYDGSEAKNLTWYIQGFTRNNADQPYAPLALEKGVQKGMQHFKSVLNAVAESNSKTLQRLLADTFRVIMRAK